MVDINEELRTLVKHTNIHDIEIANAIEEVMGVEVGTRENLLLVKEQLEARIEQIQDALKYLDDETHFYPKYCLNLLLENLEYPTLKKTNQRLDEGDY